MNQQKTHPHGFKKKNHGFSTLFDLQDIELYWSEVEGSLEFVDPDVEFINCGSASTETDCPVSKCEGYFLVPFFFKTELEIDRWMNRWMDRDPAWDYRIPLLSAWPQKSEAQKLMTEVVCMLRGTLVQIYPAPAAFMWGSNKNHPWIFVGQGMGGVDLRPPWRNLTLRSGRVVVRNGTASWGGGVFVGGILDLFLKKCMKILEWKEHIGCTESMCYTTQNRPLMRSFCFSTFFSSIVRGSLQRCFELRYFLDDRGLSTFRRLCGPWECLGLRELLSPNLCPYFPVTIGWGGLLLYIWTLRPCQRITPLTKRFFPLLGLETLMGSICQTICLEVVELFSSARVTIFSLVLPVWPFNVALLGSKEGASTWRVASSTSVQVGRNHPKMPGKMHPKHCAPLLWTYQYILWLGIHHT